ncbi:MAG: ATP-binding protein [Casimicrobium sp.]
MSLQPKLICLIGAESTGKTTLAQALASHFTCPWVPEYLREFCELQQRTPTRGEQLLILETQVIHESAAVVRARITNAPFVFCDTAPLLTAIYSEFVFGDQSLLPRARALQMRYALTLVLEPDIAWVADGQRDGVHVRQPINAMIASELAALHVPVAKIDGQGDARFASALDAISNLRD